MLLHGLLVNTLDFVVLDVLLEGPRVEGGHDHEVRLQNSDALVLVVQLGDHVLDLLHRLNAV